ncbi:serine O-acetyltransferase [Floccifex sp.]|uniref:serine O-acetyltransferase n=1 Tax=Floccifex sp. TaxID=2815810 RepID=UPI003F012649
MELDHKIERIVQHIIDDVHQNYKDKHTSQLDTQEIVEIIENAQQALFPALFGDREIISDFANKYEIGGHIEKIYSLLVYETTRALLYHPKYAKSPKFARKEKAKQIALQFIDQLPKIHEYLKTDIQAAFDGDPAATSFDEIVYSYPGFYAIFVNRIAHELYLLDVPLIPRIMTEQAHSKTGIDIHPGVTIGKYFFIDHGTGVVIGETTVIGQHVKIYQGVTLGGLSTRDGQKLRGVKRHPTIKDNVTIYSNASILGGETVIGEGCVISGNCFITHSIPDHMRVANQSLELVLKPDKNNSCYEI